MTSYLPLFEASTAADTVAIDLLAAAGADFERISITLRRGKESLVGDTLRLSLEINDQDVLLQLLRLGASDIAPANEGRTPFQISILNGFSKLVEYYARVRGESLDQLINGKKLEDATRSKPTRDLIFALKTELAIQGSLGSQEVAREATPSARAVGLLL